MAPGYPGELARRRCAMRVRSELVSYRPARPLALRDELRLRGMAARCATCRACPATARKLAAMAPDGRSDGRAAAAVVLKLAC